MAGAWQSTVVRRKLADYDREPSPGRPVSPRRRVDARRRARRSPTDRQTGIERAGLGNDRAAGRRGMRRRSARLRLLLSDRAPLPARGLRGHPQRGHDGDDDRGTNQPHQDRCARARAPAVAPTPVRRRLRNAPQLLRRSGGARHRAGHRATRSRTARIGDREHRRSSEASRAGRAQPAGVRRGRRGRRSCAQQRAVLVSRQALRRPAPRNPRPGRPGRGADPHPAPAHSIRGVANDHVASHPRRRRSAGGWRRLVEPPPRLPPAPMGRVRSGLGKTSTARHSARGSVGWWC